VDVGDLHFLYLLWMFFDLLPWNLISICCWVCVILFSCVCVGVSDSTTTSDDPSSSALYVVCVGCFLGRFQGGQGMAPLVTCSVWLRDTARSRRGSGQRNNFFWGGVFVILADFAIFSSFLN
jgi:hypothetical protein